MFEKEIWKEIFFSIKKNRIRTVLSGFTISMGIFVFILLFGLGNGLNNGFEHKYRTKVSNLITIKSGKSTQSDKITQLKNSNYQTLIKANQSKIDKSSVLVSREVRANYKTEQGIYKLVGVEGSFKELGDLKIKKGRFINPSDGNSLQKNIVIGRLVEVDLFGKISALNKFLLINGVNYRVVGVFNQEGNDLEERKIYVAYKTFAFIFNIDDNIESILVTNEKKLSVTEAISLGHQLNQQLKQQMSIDPKDQTALQIENQTEETQDADNFLFVLNLVVILIGSGTLIAGAVGISNIMLFIVKERLAEIGIRKALGAKPKDIIYLIVAETTLVMFIFGLIGMMAGVLLLASIGDGLSEIFILNPQVNPKQLLFSFATLLFFGIIAGYIPARIASKIKPVDTIRKGF